MIFVLLLMCVSIGANLYEHETIADEFQLVYKGSEGFWLETMQDGHNLTFVFYN